MKRNVGIMKECHLKSIKDHFSAGTLTQSQHCADPLCMKRHFNLLTKLRKLHRHFVIICNYRNPRKILFSLLLDELFLEISFLR